VPLREALRTLRRRWLILLLVTGVVLGAAGYFLAGQDKVYEAKATIAVLPDPDNPTLVPFYGQAVENLLPTYARLIESRTFLDRVAGDLPFETTGEALSGSVFADPAAGSGVLGIVAHTGVPEESAQIAQATAEAFLAELEGNRIVEFRLIEDAQTPLGAIAPRPRLVLGAALVVGLALAVGAALAWERLFARVNDAAQLADASQVPVLGVIPVERALQRERRVIVGDPDLFQLEERLRSIRTNLLFSATGGQGQRGPILITGINPGDGKSTIAANLAVIIGELGFSVLLIDADVHRPVQHEIFGIRNDRGLTSLVTGHAEAAGLPITTRYPHVRVVPAGPPLATRAEELSAYLRHLPQFASMADIVLVDSPPLGAADEVRLLAAFSGSVMLLIRAGSATHATVGSAVESLKVLGASVLGTVLTMAKDAPEVSTAGEYYRYRYRQDPPPGEPPRPS